METRENTSFNLISQFVFIHLFSKNVFKLIELNDLLYYMQTHLICRTNVHFHQINHL